ncbi:unnamed protein product, partial [Phaeothamnion confervicola]
MEDPSDGGDDASRQSEVDQGQEGAADADSHEDASADGNGGTKVVEGLTVDAAEPESDVPAPAGHGDGFSDREEDGDDGGVENGPPQNGMDKLVCERIKEAALNRINAGRADAGLSLLVRDEALCDAADAHCEAMSAFDYVSHWDPAGNKPYQRYADASGGHHLSETLYGAPLDASDDEESAATRQILTLIDARLAAARAAAATAGEHVLAPEHTHVGVGIGAWGGRLRYVELYADHYVELTFDGAGSSVMAGEAAAYGPCACIAYLEPPPQPLTAEELRAHFTGPYEDGPAASRVAAVAPWDMRFDPVTGAFSVPLQLPFSEAGSCYVQLFLSPDAESVPY